MKKKHKKVLARITVCAVMTVVLNLISLTGVLRAVLFLAAYLIIGYDILWKAAKGLFGGRLLDENFLMAVATVGAIALAVYEKSGDCNEAIGVMLFYQTGELFQSLAVGKSRKSISALMDIRPDCANLEADGKIEKVSPEDVEIGSVIVIQPGEKVPLDGVVIEGRSTLDTCALTGESMPRDVAVGDEIISGCINLNGVLRVRTEKEFGQSTVSKILQLVEGSSMRKSRSENFISKFARVYTPVVCASAFALAVLPPVIRLILSLEPLWSQWIYRALTFLVISCPCALVISIPLTFFAGIGGAGKQGILIKGSNFMETLAKTKTIVFDKTGTLTKGVFEVSGIHHNKIENDMLIEYAALAEAFSSHPISKSLQEAYGREIDLSRVKNTEEISGHGIVARVDSVQVAIGNSKLMKMLSIDCKECHKNGTVIHIALDGEYAGHIVISDLPKENSLSAINELKRLGIRKTVMLTGDTERVAAQVGAYLGIDEIYSELLPSDKVDRVEWLLSETDGKLAFVGDGINDAPVLSRADVGIAMGAMGSDAAIEAADIVLMDDDPMKISKGIRISRKCIRIVYENIIFALAVKLLCLLFGALGMADMWLAVFADVGVMVIAVLNAIRAIKAK